MVLALALLPLLGHAATPGLWSSFEPGQAVPHASADAALSWQLGTGPKAPYTAKATAGYSGLHALHYRSNGGSARQRLFDTDVEVQPDTTLSWLVLPEIVEGDTVASTYVSLDLLLDDGSRLSSSPARDQHGMAIGALAQGDSKTLYPQQWGRKAVRLGDVAALRGRRVVAVELEVASADGKPVSGWIDDVRLDAQPRKQPQRVSDWVLTTRGTQSNGTFSRGNNIPATAVPHGFNFWTPVTDAGSISWLYHWNERNNADNRPQLQALALSHEPSPWMGDRQTFQVMPSLDRGVPEADRAKRALSFSHDQEQARPYRYAVRFDNGIAAAIAPTDHAAVFRFDFPQEGDANLLFDNVDTRGGLTLDAATQTLSGYTDVRSGLSNGASRMYVYATFDAPCWKSAQRMIWTASPRARRTPGTSVWAASTSAMPATTRRPRSTPTCTACTCTRTRATRTSAAIPRRTGATPTRPAARNRTPTAARCAALSACATARCTSTTASGTPSAPPGRPMRCSAPVMPVNWCRASSSNTAPAAGSRAGPRRAMPT